MESGIPIPPLASGSGKSLMPWLRIHRENLSACARTCCCWVAETVGHRDLQACCAAWSWESPTPTCWRLSFGTSPPRVGSGKFGTPWERMQREKATASFWVELTCATCLTGEPPQAAASRARPAAAAITATVRAAGATPAVAGVLHGGRRSSPFTRSGGSLLRQCHCTEPFRSGRERGAAGVRKGRTWCPSVAYPG
jgi:hypothetical protein